MMIYMLAIMNERFQIPIGEMPAEFLASNIPTIAQFCVSILHNSALAGSGTLVQCGDKHGIVTAHHVVYKGNRPFDFRYGSDDAIGLLIMDTPHEFVLPLKYIVCHDIGVPVSDEEGPDLVFLEIPPGEKLGALRARKSFFNITAKKAERLSFLEDDGKGFWAISYSVDFQSTTVKMENGFPAIVVHTWVGYTGIDSRYDADEFDYIEAGVSYTSENDLPPTFGGASGGGLWKFPLSGAKRNDDKLDIEAGNPVYAGVLFYETHREENYRRIRCHGPKSLYQTMANKLLG